jgi:hypothetical protein
MEIGGIKMTREEALAYMLKHNLSAVVLEAWDVQYLIRSHGKSLAFVSRFTMSKTGRREFRKWFLLYTLRDLALATPALLAILYALTKTDK